jgi:hypothetical protein
MGGRVLLKPETGKWHIRLKKKKRKKKNKKRFSLYIGLVGLFLLFPIGE